MAIIISNSQEISNVVNQILSENGGSNVSVVASFADLQTIATPQENHIYIVQDTDLMYVYDSSTDTFKGGSTGSGGGLTQAETDALYAKIGDVYTKAQVDTALSGKQPVGTYANDADVYKKTETYTKTEVDTKIANIPTGGTGDVTQQELDDALATKANTSDVYNKTEVDDKIAAIPTGGEVTQQELTDGLATKSDVTHTHDGVYAAYNHDHNTVYSPIGHNHEGIYSPVTHTHDGVYQPVGDYANADDVYTKAEVYTKDEVDAEIAANAGGGSGSSHEHDNLATLDKFTEQNGELKFVEIDTTSIVPALTSASQDGYVVTASSQYNLYEAYKAFDGDNNNTFWTTGGPTDGWLRIDLPTPQTVYAFSIFETIDNANPGHIRDFKFQGSNDNGTTWVDLFATTNQQFVLGENQFEVTPGEYQSYRLNVSLADSGWFQLNELKLFGGYLKDVSLAGHAHPELSSDLHSNFGLLESLGKDTNGNLTIEKVGTSSAIPVMTGDTTNGYTASADKFYSSTPAWNAFDGRTDLYWCPGGPAPTWLRIDLPTPKKFVGFRIHNSIADGSAGHARTFRIEGSNNGTDWTTVFSVANYVWSMDYNNFTISSPGTYSSYRLLITAHDSDWMQLNELQFFEAITVDVRKYDPNEKTYVNATISANKSWAAATQAKVVFDGAKTDTLSEYDIATGVFTAKKTGTYIVNAGIYTAATTNSQRTVMFLFKNDVLLKRMGDYSNQPNKLFQPTGVTVIQLNAGDRLEFQTYIDQATTVYAVPESTYFTIYQL